MSNILGNNGGRFYSTLVRPVLIECSYTVASSNSNGLGITGLKGANVRDVFMYTSASAGKGNGGLLNPMAQSASQGYALIKLKDNYNRYVGGFQGFESPVTGSNLAINSTALTVGTPYAITAVGHAAAGAVTIAPVGDSSGSLASTYFSLYDGYGNKFIIWFFVTGVGGSAPIGVSGTLVQQTIAQNASAGTIGTALASTIALLPSGVSGVFSFTTAGTTTVTCTSTQTNPYGPVAGAPMDGAIATGFTFASTVFNTNLTNWQTVGLPKGIIPNIGVSFFAIAQGQSSGGGSTGTVKAVSVSGISNIEVVGDPNQSIAPVPQGGSPNVGGWILVQFLAQSSAFTYNSGTPASSTVATTMVPTQPANGSVVTMSFYVEQSSVTIAGD